MATRLTVVSAGKPEEERATLSPKDKFRHFRNVMGVVVQDAQDTWADLWRELQGEIVDGVLILPAAERSVEPRCGWPEFMEKMWMLKHQLDYARRFSEGRM